MKPKSHRLTCEILTAPQEYSVIIESGIFQRAGSMIVSMVREKNISVHRILILTDSRVCELYGEALLQQFLEYNNITTHIYSFKAGEAQKNASTQSAIESFLCEQYFHRDSLLVVLGGGVVGDLGGFVASVFLRGLPYVYIPTTVIAQADSSIGGKTGINTEHGKNQRGTFYHPKMVLSDPVLLLSLDDQEYYSGVSEIIKHAIILDRQLFSTIKNNKQRITQRDLLFLQELIYTSCSLKKHIIQTDPYDRGSRHILNFGHTLGHALEHYSNYTHSHGECVAFGMLAEGLISHKLNHLPLTELYEIQELLEYLHLLKNTLFTFNPHDLYAYTLQDKKNRGAHSHYALPKQIGCMLKEGDSYTIPVNKDIVLEVLKLLRVA